VLKEKSGEVLFDGGYDRSLDGVVCFKSHAVACGRQGRIPRVWIPSSFKLGGSLKNVTSYFKRANVLHD
jgi:hypothetical protein